MNRLAQIIATKQNEILPLLPRLSDFRSMALQRNEFRGFKQAISPISGSLGIISEVKKASPSAGVICQKFDPLGIAQSYERGGASAISVLTDKEYFGGSLYDLEIVRSAVGLPVLRKDFTIHEVQIYEASASGADAVLLIVAALDQKDFLHLLSVATLCQLDTIVEVHNMEELDRALDSSAEIIGINNRNLKTFEIDLSTTELLASQIDDEIIVISESGIKTEEDVRRVREAGADAILVGESLMRSGDPIAVMESFSRAGRLE
jgi:indole-3-glycerol phosphate synthase